jgi:DNA-binding beta-propeller fold protein YncE
VPWEFRKYSRPRRLKSSLFLLSRIAGNNTANHSGDGGPPADEAGLGSPWGIAVDSSGALYIAEPPFFVRQISSGMINTAAGDGTQGFSGDGGPASNAQLDSPSGVAVDAAGAVYVADSANNRIRVLVPSGARCSHAAIPLSRLLDAPSGNEIQIRGCRPLSQLPSPRMGGGR